MLDLTILVSPAAFVKAVVIIGKVIIFKKPTKSSDGDIQPLDGSNFNFTEKIIIKKIPIQNCGIDNTNNEKLETLKSVQLPLFQAETIPAGIANNNERNKDPKVITNVLGILSNTKSNTGEPSLIERPNFP